MDRRFVWAIVLMMAIVIGPTFFLKKPVRPPAGAADSTVSTIGPAPLPEAGSHPAPVSAGVSDSTTPADTVDVISPLYRYSFSTKGGYLIQAELKLYKSLAPGEKGQPARLAPDGSGLYQLAFVTGNDTVSFADWTFTPSAEGLRVDGATSLTFTAQHGGRSAEITYGFRPDDYRVQVNGKLTGFGPDGGTLIVGLGDGLRQTEADSTANQYTYGVVTKTDESHLTTFAKFSAGETTVLSGPFEWVAVKAKYFATALLTVDSATSSVSGITARPVGDQKHPLRVAVRAGIPVGPSGVFAYGLYAGPMEYPRLKAIGHDFYDINPYGWPGFRTIIRPIAVTARSLLVWMHDRLNLPFGLVLVIFGVAIRLILWPLNQKGMRASMKMQAIQPEMKALQDRHKDDPAALQGEIFKLYKTHQVNPFSGCWPMLLPWPVLLALFFVFQNTIELRGQSFLWLPDLSLKDPLFILPVLMGLSLYGVSKIGQMGMEPNPQMKTMLYMMPVIMTVMFLNFASGLNLYYFIQNVASIPQQWMLAQERMKAKPPVAPKVEVRVKRK